VRFGIPITEEITFSPRYSIYNTNLTIPNSSSHPYDDCQNPIWGTTPGFNGTTVAWNNSCLTNGEASLALKEETGNTLTSMFGYTLSFNTLNNNKNPSSGWLAELRQDIAGAGGDSRFVRTTGDVRYYHEIYDQIVGIARVQGGEVFGYGGDPLRIVNNFNLGPSLVRGFAPSGIGPRDVSGGAYAGNALGGTTYFGGNLEVQFPIWGLPRDLGLKGAIFADAGSLFNYTGKTNFSYLSGGVCTPNNTYPLYTQGTCIQLGANAATIRSAAGASLIWSSPLGPIRFDFAKAITKSQYDQTQFFRFTGGTTF
jgi:outer membrane protein insertion porin family